MSVPARLLCLVATLLVAVLAIGFRTEARPLGTPEAHLLRYEGVTRQASNRDCGIAAAHMLLVHIGVEVAYDSLLSRYHPKDELQSMLDLKHLFRDQEVNVAGYQLQIADLARVPVPLIAHVPDHYVVVDSLRRDTVFVRDPAAGRMALHVTAFEDWWTGATLIVE